MLSPIETARRLRQDMTWPEHLLWTEVRNRRFNNCKFRRQHPIIYEVLENFKRFYIADFYCAEKKLIIEFDGKHHEFGDPKEYDHARDLIMTQMGLRILRINNEEFFPLCQTLNKINDALNEGK